jgi:hypothetical protein
MLLALYTQSWRNVELLLFKSSAQLLIFHFNIIAESRISTFYSAVTVLKPPQSGERLFLLKCFVVSPESFQGIMSVIPQIKPSLFLPHSLQFVIH